MAKPTPTPAKKSNSKLPLIFGAIAVVIIGGGIVLAVGHKSSTMSGMNMSTSSPSTANATATDMVTVANYAFSPAAITVKAGTKVTWTQTDAVSHTITSDSGNMLSSSLLARGQTYSYTFTKAGTYTYHCTPHPYMKGTVVVTN